MLTRSAALHSFILVAGVHASVLAALVMSPSAPIPQKIAPASIQGTLVAIAPKELPPPDLPDPPPRKKPLPRVAPPPKAPPSERAINLPEPLASSPINEPEEQKPIEPRLIPPNADASDLNNPAPVYPRISRRLGEKGIVVLTLSVKADGSVGEVSVKTSSGYKRLDEAAIKAIKRWHFIPASQAGKPVAYRYEIDFEFGLRHEKNKS